MKAGREIIICDNHEPISLDNVIINISHEKPILPEDVEDRVKANWVRFKESRSNAVDNEVAYLVEYSYSEGTVTAEVFTAGFSYNQYLNRSDIEMKDSRAGLYEPLASWMLAVCDNGNYALFGHRKDYGNKRVSAFGGFTSQVDIVGDKINTEQFVQRILTNEMKDMSSSIVGVSMIGLNYYPKVGPKGFDGVYVAELEGKPEELQTHFSECDQFSTKLISVRTDPKSLIKFLEHEHWHPTRSCVAGVFSYIGSRYGRDELNAALSSYSGRDKIHVVETPFIGSVADQLASIST